LSNAGVDLNCGSILALLAEIKKIGPVRRVTADFTNWISSDQGWQPLQDGTPRPRPAMTEAAAPAHTSGSFNVYEVKEKPVEPATEPGTEE
jgi:hypothetical protein